MRFASLVIAALVFIPSAPAFAAAPKTAVVVPTQLSGWFPRRDEYQTDLDLSLSDRLRMVKYAVLKREALSEPDQRCTVGDCLVGLLGKYSVDAAVQARVTNDQQEATTFHLFVRVALRRDSQAPELREREKKCANCALARVRDELVELVGAAIAGTPVTPPIEPNHIEPKASPAPVTPADRTTENVYWAVGSVGAVAFIGGVVALGVEGSRNGNCKFNPAAGERCSATVDVTNPMIVSGVVALIGLAAGSAFYALAARERKKNGPHAWLAPMGAPHIAGLAVGGTF